SRAKHRSLAGHSRLARRVARLVPFYEYDEARFFSSDDAPAEIVARRRAGFARLATLYAERFPVTAPHTAELEDSVSDLQFTARYRVPFQYSRFVRRHLNAGALVQSSSGVTVTDLDGNRFYDLAGSYGVNVFGHDFYKACIDRAVERVRSLGPVLGSYHPVIAYNVERLKAVSGLDEVSFHMSGTEAVMQAGRVARAPPPRCAARRVLWRVPRLVGGRSAGGGEPGAGARDLHAEGHERGCAAGAAQAARYRLRPRESAASPPSERHGAQRFGAGRQRAERPVRPGGGCVLARRAARRLHRAADSAHPRRGLHRLPPRAGRRAGVLRRPGGHGHLRQDARRRPAGRRGLRPQGADEALPGRPSDGHLLRARHLQLASLRDGGDARIPAASRHSRAPRPVPRSGRGLESSGGAAEPAAPGRGLAGPGREPLDHLDHRLHATVAV